LPYCPSCGREIAGDSIFCPHCGRNLNQTARSGVQYYGAIDPDASTARTVTLVAIILQVIFFAIGIFVVSFFFFVAMPITISGIGTSPAVTPPSFPIFGLVAFVFSLSFLVSIVWIALDYFLVYRNLGSTSTIAAAKTPSIVLGVVQLIFGGVIPGILLIVAYIKIGDSMQRRGQTA
jgi:hypothetical protein